ncbi:MAG: integrase [Gammaproteobacteria bacterium]|nr:integrase [Gammaproteobacteria bacterium]MDD9824808.1 integrase [Gammaproteobacteria bacterium]
MTQMIAELRQALVEAGASEAMADAAAQAVAVPPEQMATKADLAALEARLTWRLVGAVVAAQGLAVAVLIAVLR